MPPAPLTAAQARRTALAAQGFTDPRPAPGTATMRHVRRAIDRMQVIQIDSVNVVTRSHYLPFYSRLGVHDPALVDRARDGAGPDVVGDRLLVESWAHMASLVPPSTWPWLSFRRARALDDSWFRRVVAEHPDVVEQVREVVGAQGPLTAREVDAVVQHQAHRSRENWGWNWSVVKQCLEYLFWAGDIASAGRNQQFERRYCAPGQVIPGDLLAQEPDLETCAIHLMRLAVRAHGVGTVSDLRDYFRMKRVHAEPALEELVRLGEVDRVAVAGWDAPAYLDPSAKRPRKVEARALLSPFDPVVWDRGRALRVFDFHYRIEIYTPAAKRVFGYYVLPFLLGDTLVARVDLKADRASSRLLVRRIHLEPDAPAHTRAELAAELRVLADFLGLADVSDETGVLRSMP